MNTKKYINRTLLSLVLLLMSYFGHSESITAATLSGTWSYTGSLNVSRNYGGHTVTRLQDGRVLVAGGGGGVSNVEIYNPTTQTWSNVASMQEGRNGHSATLLSNGKVLVVGGTSSSGYSTTAELYDPTTNTWSYTSGPVRERGWHQATRLSDGRVLMTGGWQPTSGGGFTFRYEVDIYDPATDTWNYTGHGLSRVAHTATLLSNGNVLLVGGFYNAPIDEVKIYNPSANTLVDTGTLRTRRASHSATLLVNGTVLVAGGRDDTSYGGPPGLASAEIYNPATGNWSYTGNMQALRSEHSATRLADGSVLVAGGRDYTPNVGKIASAELYDPATGLWVSTGSLNEPRSGQAVLLNDGKVLFPGGSDLSASSVELYTLNPIVNINYSSGAPGSFFTLTGERFPPDSTATIRVNGRTLGQVSTDSEGGFTFLLSTTDSDEGTYFVTVTVNPVATVRFILNSSEPVRLQEGSGTVFDVPTGIAFTQFVFLPVVSR